MRPHFKTLRAPLLAHTLARPCARQKFSIRKHLSYVLQCPSLVRPMSVFFLSRVNCEQYYEFNSQPYNVSRVCPLASSPMGQWATFPLDFRQHFFQLTSGVRDRAQTLQQPTLHVPYSIEVFYHAEEKLKSFSAGALPRTLLGELATLPRPSSRLGKTLETLPILLTPSPPSASSAPRTYVFTSCPLAPNPGNATASVRLYDVCAFGKSVQFASLNGLHNS